MTDQQISSVMNCFKFTYKQWIENENDHLYPDAIKRLKLRPRDHPEPSLSKSEKKKFMHKLEKAENREFKKTGMDSKLLDEFYSLVDLSTVYIQKRQDDIIKQQETNEHDIMH